MLIRHGATKLNNDDVSVDRIRGWKDIPLSEDGRKEANDLGRKIIKDPPDVIISSDLKRAADTAKIISKITDVPVAKFSKMFRPWNVGEYAGKVSSEVIPKLAHAAENEPDKPLPDGECFNDFRNRFFRGLNDAMDRYKGTIAIVTHHRGERLLKAWESAGFPNNGDIDIKTFNKKGEHTGAVMNINIPERKVEDAVEKR